METKTKKDESQCIKLVVHYINNTHDDISLGLYSSEELPVAYNWAKKLYTFEIERGLVSLIEIEVK